MALGIRVLSLSELPDVLVERFVNGDGVLWTGAGVSQQSNEIRNGHHTRVGVPGAARLLERLKKSVTPPLPQPETLADIASLYVFQHGRGQLNRLIDCAYRAAGVAAPRFYDAIASLPTGVRVFVTTNYDPFLERAIAYRDPIVVVRDHGLSQVSASRAVIYKPHGDAKAPADCVITTSDYDSWTRSSGNLPEVLATLFLQSTVVAVGYRANDDNFRRLLGAVNSKIRESGDTPHTMYVATPEAELNTFSAYAGEDFDLVLIPASGDNFLQWLIDRLKQRRKQSESEAISQLLDPEAVRIARSKVDALESSIASVRIAGRDISDAEWQNYAEALDVLAIEEDRAARIRDSLTTKAKAERAYRLAGQVRKADGMFSGVLRQVLHEMKDQELFVRLRSSMGIGEREAQRLAEPLDDDTQMLLALGEIMSGIPDKQPKFIEALEHRTLEGTSDQSFVVAYQVERLRAEHAINHFDFSTAEQCFHRAGEVAPDALSKSECEIRGTFFSGLNPDATAQRKAIDRLSALIVGSSIEQLRNRAIGWLSVLAGNLDDAATAFQRAAQKGIADVDVIGAKIGFRGASWADRQRPLSEALRSTTQQAAYRLRALGHNDVPGRTDSDSLLDAAGRHIIRGETRSAWVSGCSALRLAYDDLDPVGVLHANERLAEIWRRVLESESDQFSLFWATHYMARARASIRDGSAEEWTRPLRNRLSSHSPSANIGELVAHVTKTSIGRFELTGCLLLLSDIAESLDGATLHEYVAPAIRRGLQTGWSFSSADPARAACTLLTAVHARLAAADAQSIKEAFLAILSQTPPFRLEEAYLGLAQSTIMSPPMSDGGSNQADLLLTAHERALRSSPKPNYISVIGIAMAATAERSSQEVGRRLISTLVDEADVGRWDGLATLAARGVSLDQHIADRYLTLITARLRRLLQSADSASAFGLGVADLPNMRRYVAEAASKSFVDDTLDELLAFVSSDKHWSVNRAAWMDLLAHILLKHRDKVEEVRAPLARLAKGEYVEPGDLSNFTSNHILSAFRINFGAGTNLRARALTVLGAVYDINDRNGAEIMSILTDAVTDSNEDVRAGAIIGIGEGAKRHGSHLNWARSALTRALGDSNPEVVHRAKEYLQEINVENDTEEADSKKGRTLNNLVSEGND